MNDRMMPRAWMTLTAFAAVYIIWGSTYLAIRVAVETIPPYTMMGTRFGLAGLIMYGWLRFRGSAVPTAAQWRSAAIIGGLMLLLGTGSVGWAEQYIPSGIAATLVASVPLWMVLLDWLWKKNRRPHATVFFGLIIGTAGVILLFDPVAIIRQENVPIIPGVVILLGALAWSVGSIHSRTADLPSNQFLTTAMEMTAGGVLLLAVGFLRGEWSTLEPALITGRSVAGWLYLIVFGSFIAFSAYIWLLREVTPAKVATYAYVNPGVAVLLGAMLLNEPLNIRIFFALALLVSSVIMITRVKSNPRHDLSGSTHKSPR